LEAKNSLIGTGKYPHKTSDNFLRVFKKLQPHQRNRSKDTLPSILKHVFLEVDFDASKLRRVWASNHREAWALKIQISLGFKKW